MRKRSSWPIGCTLPHVRRWRGCTAALLLVGWRRQACQGQRKKHLPRLLHLLLSARLVQLCLQGGALIATGGGLCWRHSGRGASWAPGCAAYARRWLFCAVSCGGDTAAPH